MLSAISKHGLHLDSDKAGCAVVVKQVFVVGILQQILIRPGLRLCTVGVVLDARPYGS